MLLASVPGALGDVALGPLAEAGRDLLDALAGVVLVVAKVLVILLGILVKFFEIPNADLVS